MRAATQQNSEQQRIATQPHGSTGLLSPSFHGGGYKRCLLYTSPSPRD